MRLSKLIKEANGNYKPTMTPEESVKYMNEQINGKQISIPSEYQEKLVKVTIEKMKDTPTP